MLSQWVTHRDPRWFPDPEGFSPDRWEDKSAAQLPRFAYFPFGGPRVCIGAGFAVTESDTPPCVDCPTLPVASGSRPTNRTAAEHHPSSQEWYPCPDARAPTASLTAWKLVKSLADRELGEDGEICRVLPTAAHPEIAAAFTELNAPQYEPALALFNWARHAYDDRSRRDRECLHKPVP